jgi:small subunit ribosomal protein S6
LPANVYEGMFILESNRFGRDPEVVSNQVPAMIEKLGGEILVSRLWEERRLAYPIKGQRKGTYWLTYFRLDSLKLGDLKRQCQITDDILRVLFLKVDPRIVDALVAHAMSAPVVIHTDEPVKAAVEDDIDEAIPVIDAVEDPVGLEEDA